MAGEETSTTAGEDIDDGFRDDKSWSSCSVLVSMMKGCAAQLVLVPLCQKQMACDVLMDVEVFIYPTSLFRQIPGKNSSPLAQLLKLRDSNHLFILFPNTFSLDEQ